jgi:hypothetical protein
MKTSKYIEQLKKGLTFDKLYDDDTKEVLSDSPLFIPWTSAYYDIEKFCLNIHEYQFGIDYYLGTRTIFDDLTFSWTSRAGLNKNELFNSITAQLGWDDKGYEAFLKTRIKLIDTLGQPHEELNNFNDYKKVLETYGPFNFWHFEKTHISLHGMDMRGSFIFYFEIKYKVD